VFQISRYVRRRPVAALIRRFGLAAKVHGPTASGCPVDTAVAVGTQRFSGLESVDQRAFYSNSSVELALSSARLPM
jgi:hypothetical protein